MEDLAESNTRRRRRRIECTDGRANELRYGGGGEIDGCKMLVNEAAGQFQFRARSVLE